MIKERSLKFMYAMMLLIQLVGTL